MKGWSRLVVAMLCASTARAAEVVHLSNGYDVHCIRRELVGNVTRLYLDAGGFIDVPSPQISGYELDPVPLLPPPKPLPMDSSAGNGLTAYAPLPGNVAATRDASTIRDHIRFASMATGVDPDFIESVIRVESGYNAAAISPKGARGLMQLMPSTAASLGVRDSLDPKANIDGGSRYLREMLVRFDGDAIRALAAYNAGPEKVERYKGVPPYRETRQYVARVVSDYNRRKLSAPDRGAADKSHRVPSRAAKRTNERDADGAE